ncbi:MAG: succinate dehydrogenase [Acidobacteria bacterium]|nr:succinate dehydrogenase [Acidobacteriota bacterium]
MSNIFLLRRLHSLTGVIPIGAFLIEHFYINFSAVDSPEAFNQTVANLRVIFPGLMLPIVELFFIAIPLVFHAFLGIYISFTMKNNISHYSYLRNWFYLSQRITGVFLVFYIALHVASMRFGFWGLGNRLSVNEHAMDLVDSPFAIVHADLSQPIVLAFYILGIIAASYHLAYGLWSFAIHWGITISEKSQSISLWVCITIAIIIFILGLSAALAFI